MNVESGKKQYVQGRIDEKLSNAFSNGSVSTFDDAYRDYSKTIEIRESWYLCIKKE